MARFRSAGCGMRCAGGRPLRRALAVASLLVMSMGISPTAEAATFNTYNFSFRYCSWTLRIYENSLVRAEAKTTDVNGGCRYIDAAVKYENGAHAAPRPVYTKSCTAAIASTLTCARDGDATMLPLTLAGWGGAQDEESWHWQYSGWINH